MDLQRLEKLAWEGDRAAEKALRDKCARRNLLVPVWIRAATSPKPGCVVVDLPPHPQIRIHLIPNKDSGAPYHLLLLANQDCTLEWGKEILWISHVPYQCREREAYPVTYWWNESPGSSPVTSGVIAHTSGVIAQMEGM